MLSKTLAFLGMASAATAHIIMTNPVPYGNPSNSPLDASGADFPCKNASPDGSVGQNVYKAGSTQSLTFQGTAVHGGGSCQVSVTTDLNPTRDSKWKVIKSIEGGCPARDTVGNIGNDASAPVPYEYDFQIPEEMPEGEYVLAWTWFNKVGNREMYMNCASVQINGGSGDESFLSTLPDMFVANIGEECGTKDSTDVEFPNPGKVVERLNGATDAFDTPTGPGCPAPSGGGGGDSPDAPQPTASVPSAPEDPAPTSAPIATSASISTGPKPTPTIPGGVFITVPTSASVVPTATPEPEQPTQPEEPAEPEQPQPEEPTTPEPEVPSPGSGSGSQAAGSPCTTEGTWNCVGGSSFQRCASGVWSQIMNLAQGTSCDEGQSDALSVHASAGKRAMRRAQRISY